MSLMFFLFIFLFISIAVLLSILVLIQESKSLGFGASFGGDSSSSLFGSSTAAIVKQITGYLIVAFISGCLISSFWSHALSKAPKAVDVQIESTDTLK